MKKADRTKQELANQGTGYFIGVVAVLLAAKWGGGGGGL